VEHQSLFFPDGWKLLLLIIQIAPQKTLERIPFKKASITRQNRKEVAVAISTEIFPPELEQSNWKK
jgi:hypothetical protein